MVVGWFPLAVVVLALTVVPLLYIVVLRESEAPYRRVVGLIRAVRRPPGQARQRRFLGRRRKEKREEKREETPHRAARPARCRPTR